MSEKVILELPGNQLRLNSHLLTNNLRAQNLRTLGLLVLIEKVIFGKLILAQVNLVLVQIDRVELFAHLQVDIYRFLIFEFILPALQSYHLDAAVSFLRPTF